MSWPDIITGILCWEILKYILINWWYEIFKNR